MSPAQRLDRLFDQLRAAANTGAAKNTASEIERLLERSGSDTADLMLQRAKTAITDNDFLLALDLLDHLIPLRPDWAEPYHRRAIVHFLMKDEESTMRDIRATLAREPRHFQALAGLGTLLRGMGDKKGAFKAFSRAVEIHPFFDDLKDTLDKMRPEIEGQPI